jgi:hypothetical protein
VLAARLLAWTQPNPNDGADQRRFQTVLLDILAAGLTTASQLGAVTHLLRRKRWRPPPTIMFAMAVAVASAPDPAKFAAPLFAALMRAPVVLDRLRDGGVIDELLKRVYLRLSPSEQCGVRGTWPHYESGA